VWPDYILARLDAKPCGRPSTWRCRCPMPEHSRGDRERSLSLWLLGSERLAVGCWACRARHGGSHSYKWELLSRVGLTMGDLFRPREDENGAYDWKHRKARPLVQEKIVAVYEYLDEDGRVLYEKVRFDPKRFSQRRLKDGGGYSWGIERVRRVPFQLCELLRKPHWPCILCEGEKNVLNIERLGLLATCVTEGAGSGWGFDSPYPAFFVDRRVVVIPDEDAPGLNHAAHVAGALLMGGAASVRLVRLSGLEFKPTHGPDVSDWIEAGGTRDELVALIQRYAATHAGRLAVAVHGAPADPTIRLG
jgi:hypothetical protein